MARADGRTKTSKGRKIFQIRECHLDDDVTQFLYEKLVPSNSNFNDLLD